MKEEKRCKCCICCPLWHGSHQSHQQLSTCNVLQSLKRWICMQFWVFSLISGKEKTDCSYWEDFYVYLRKLLNIFGTKPDMWTYFSNYDAFFFFSDLLILWCAWVFANVFLQCLCLEMVVKHYVLTKPMSSAKTASAPNWWAIFPAYNFFNLNIN